MAFHVTPTSATGPALRLATQVTGTGQKDCAGGAANATVHISGQCALTETGLHHHLLAGG